jgi:hypothetical protein
LTGYWESVLSALHIFLKGILLAICICASFRVYANGPLQPQNEPVPITEERAVQMQSPGTAQSEIDAICEGFLQAVKAGEIATAKKFIAPSAHGKLDTDFARLHQILKNVPLPIERYTEKAPYDGTRSRDNLWTAGYSVRSGERWQNAKLTIFYLNGEPKEIDAWEFTVDARALESKNMQTEAEVALFFRFAGLNILLAFFGLILVAGLMWIRPLRRHA